MKAVAAKTIVWKDTVTVGTPDAPKKTCALYASDAVLWGTVSEEVRETPEQIYDYFVSWCTVVEGALARRWQRWKQRKFCCGCLLRLVRVPTVMIGGRIAFVTRSPVVAGLLEGRVARSI